MNSSMGFGFGHCRRVGLAAAIAALLAMALPMHANPVRAQTTVKEPAQQALETTTEEKPPEDESSGSIWSLWGQ